MSKYNLTLIKVSDNKLPCKYFPDITHQESSTTRIILNMHVSLASHQNEMAVLWHGFYHHRQWSVDVGLINE